jgi:hypothetical protein
MAFTALTICQTQTNLLNTPAIASLLGFAFLTNV